MNVQQLKVGDWIFTKAIFGEGVYKVLEVVKNVGAGVEVKTSYGTATFSLMLSNNNCRHAIQSDL